MANSVTLSVAARADIKAIIAYGYREFGEGQARRYKAALDDCLQLIARNPTLGRECDDIRPGYRRHEHRRHIIFYRQNDDALVIVRVLHDSMDVERQLRPTIVKK